MARGDWVAAERGGAAGRLAWRRRRVAAWRWEQWRSGASVDGEAEEGPQGGGRLGRDDAAAGVIARRRSARRHGGLGRAETAMPRIWRG